MKTLITALIIGTVVLSSHLALFVSAQGTPDGETPAQETFCNQYDGLNGPLFALCTTYCEANDCNSDTPQMPRVACDVLGKSMIKAAAKAFGLDYHNIVVNDVCSDTDNDGHPDFLDNCPFHHNPTQANTDGDAWGNACDNCALVFQNNQLDTDGDGRGDLCDNCPSYGNPLQEDNDFIGGGSDGVGDVCDNCPQYYNPGQEDADEDGIGDVCACPCSGIYTEFTDRWETEFGIVTSSCFGVGQAGPPQTQAEFFSGSVAPNSYEMTMKTSISGTVNECSAILNIDGGSPPEYSQGLTNLTAEQVVLCNTLIEQARTDLCIDTDGDGRLDGADNCPTVSNPQQEDLDGDGIGDACDPQTCGNGVIEGTEECDGGVGCSSTCTIEVSNCGNGITESPEQCDDGNAINGDGCSSTCQTEATICPCAGVYAQGVDIWTNQLNHAIDTCTPTNLGNDFTAQQKRVVAPDNGVSAILFGVRQPDPGTDVCTILVVVDDDITLLTTNIDGLTDAEGDACFALMNVLCPL